MLPFDIPVSAPSCDMVAIAALVQLHVPLLVVSFSVTRVPMQPAVAPLIVPAELDAEAEYDSDDREGKTE